MIGEDQPVDTLDPPSDRSRTTSPDPAAVFEQYRRLLFAIAYRMLGSATDAEDVVQDCFVRWFQSGQSAESPKSYLSSVAVNLCIDRLRSARAHREVYVGPWLPEPIATDQPELGESVALTESLSFAFLLLLERLNPVERAVFLLREVFEYGYDEVAAAVGKSEANCRQIHHRARQRIGDRPRFRVSYQEHERITAEFLQAASTGDVARLTALLAEDVVFRGDGGGKVRTALKEVKGRDNVTRGLFGGIKWLPAGTQPRLLTANGQPAILLHVNGEPVQLVLLQVGDGQIRRIDSVLNPEKLGWVGRQR